MGYKITQALTSSGYKKSGKSKPNQNSQYALTSKKSSLYKEYKNLYKTLKSKYQSSKQYISINSIMTRTHMGTKISSSQNRELALIDTDKLLSLSIGLMKQNDQRVQIMRMVVDEQKLGRPTQQMFFFQRLGDANNNFQRRLQRNEERINDLLFRNNNIEVREQPTEELPRTEIIQQINTTPRGFPFNQDITIQQQRPTPFRGFDPNQGQRNALGIIRLVRAARIRYMRMSEQLEDLSRPQIQVQIPLPRQNNEARPIQAQAEMIIENQAHQGNEMEQILNINMNMNIGNVGLDDVNINMQTTLIVEDINPEIILQNQPVHSSNNLE